MVVMKGKNNMKSKYIIERDQLSELGGFEFDQFNDSLEFAYAECARMIAKNPRLYCVNLYKHTKGDSYNHIARFRSNGYIQTKQDEYACLKGTVKFTTPLYELTKSRN